MRLDTPHEIRDPIHGLIRLTDQELRVINTPVFQRLRRIRQLAMADLVYPGALHTRFEHLLGTLQVAWRMLERLDAVEHMFDNDVEDARIVRLAALLHDIGHGPFSHVSEYLLGDYYDQDKVGEAASRDKIHEKLAVDIVRRQADIATVLTDHQREQIASIIEGPSLHDWRRDVVSSSLDADKMDYLLRDAYYAGVQYGRYDLDKVIESCRLLRRGQESWLMVDHEGLFAVEQLVLAKHHMTQQIYAHRVRTVTDLMIVRGLKLAIEADDWLRSVYTYDGSDDHQARYLGVDDGIIATVILQGQERRAKEIYQRLRDRRLFKELALITIDRGYIGDSLLRAKLGSLTDQKCVAMEPDLATVIGCEPWQVIVHRKSVKNPAYQPPGAPGPEDIQVLDEGGEPKTLSQFGDLVQAVQPRTERLHVVAPWDAGESLADTERREERQKLQQRIIERVYETLGGRP